MSVSCTQVTQGKGYVILGTEANEQQALNYGCIVEEPTTHRVCVDYINTYIKEHMKQIWHKLFLALCSLIEI